MDGARHSWRRPHLGEEALGTSSPHERSSSGNREGVSAAHPAAGLGGNKVRDAQSGVRLNRECAACNSGDHPAFFFRWDHAIGRDVTAATGVGALFAQRRLKGVVTVMASSGFPSQAPSVEPDVSRSPATVTSESTCHSHSTRSSDCEAGFYLAGAVTPVSLGVVMHDCITSTWQEWALPIVV